MNAKRTHRTDRASLAIAVIAAATYLAADPAAAQVACGATLGPGGTTTLSADVGPCDGGGASITVESATLDLGGHTITCADTDMDGILSDGVILVGKKATLRNGSIVGCDFGVDVTGSGKHRVEGITATNSGRDGIFIQSTKNRVSGNTTSNNGDEGIQIQADKNTVTGNTANNNAGDGINVVQGNKNKVISNTVSGSGDEGFQIIGTKNQVKGNTATANATQGINVDGSKNQIKGNTATGSIGGPDAIDSAGSAGCRLNKWKGNTFGTRSPDCIK